MITKSCLSFTAIAAAFIFLIYTVDDASARGKGGRGGAHAGKSRGGGAHHAGKSRGSRGGGYSRQGSAKSGSFSSKSKRASQPRHKKTASSAPKTANRSGTKQNRKQSGTKQNRKQGPNENNVGDRQDGRTDRTEARQDGATDRAKSRQATAYYASQNNNYYGGRYYDDDDWDGGEVAAVALGAAALGYAVGQSNAESTAPSTTTVVYSASPSGSGGLPCNPNTAVVNKVTYYQCGNNWYTQAYGESGVMYMPVPAPY